MSVVCCFHLIEEWIVISWSESRSRHVNWLVSESCLLLHLAHWGIDCNLLSDSRKRTVRKLFTACLTTLRTVLQFVGER